MSVISCNIDFAKTIVKKTVKQQFRRIVEGEKATNVPIMLHSSPGIGKSDAVRQIVRELGTELNKEFGMVDLRLASREASDVNGIPYVSYAKEGEEEMKMSVPAWFPTEAKIADGRMPEYGIIFCDELSNAPIPVQHAGYRLVNDRELESGHKLPNTWVVLAAGNSKADKTGAKQIAPALANRFGMHLFIEADVEAFQKYMIQQGWNQEIVGFMMFSPESMYTFDPSKNELAFATPRSWEKVNELLAIDYSNEELAVVLAGCVGSKVSSGFLAFRKYYESLPNFEAIMDGKEEYKIPKKDQGLVFAVTSALIQHLMNNYKNEKRLKNLDKLFQQLEDDFLILVTKNFKNAMGVEAATDLIVTLPDTMSRITKYV